MTTNHIDQLAQWWESADQVAPMRGDLVIENVSDEDGQDYRVRNWPGDRREKLSYVRVLEPKPKPAWHDAKAVIAYTDHCERQVWERDSSIWVGTAGDVANTEDLRGVTPLIKAKVTEEMVVHATATVYGIDKEKARSGLYVYERDECREIITAALGMEES